METDEQVAPKKKKPTRQLKVDDVATPIGEYQQRAAQDAKEQTAKNPIVKKWYELIGTKLCFKKQKVSGRTISEYVGNVADVKDAPKEYQDRRRRLLEQIKRLDSEGKLIRRL